MKLEDKEKLNNENIDLKHLKNLEERIEEVKFHSLEIYKALKEINNLPFFPSKYHICPDTSMKGFVLNSINNLDLGSKKIDFIDTSILQTKPSLSEEMEIFWKDSRFTMDWMYYYPDNIEIIDEIDETNEQYNYPFNQLRKVNLKSKIELKVGETYILQFGKSSETVNREMILAKMENIEKNINPDLYFVNSNKWLSETKKGLTQISVLKILKSKDKN